MPQKTSSRPVNAGSNIPPSPDTLPEILQALPDRTGRPGSSIDLIPEVQTLYQDYVDGFQQQVPLDTQVERAEALVVAILSHYYPKDKNFMVEPANLSMLAGNGWNFWVVRPDYKPFPKKKGGGRWDPERPFLPDEKGTKPAAPTYTGWGADTFHHIPAERIKGFRVLRKQLRIDDDGKPIVNKQPVTYAAIMMDDLSTFDKWVPDYLQLNDKLITNPRQDVLRYSLGVEAEISKGYGVILLGPRLEFYNYDWKGARLDPPDSILTSENIKWNFTKSADPEPLSQLERDHWMVDVRTQGLSEVDEMFKKVVQRPVEYQR
jgi:hypothetical protein